MPDIAGSIGGARGCGGALLHPLLTAAALRACRQGEVRLAQRLRLHCQQCLAEAGPKRETAGVLLGRLLVRSDCLRKPALLCGLGHCPAAVHSACGCLPGAWVRATPCLSLRSACELDRHADMLMARH